MLSALDRFRLLAQVFTRPVFANMARAGSWQSALRFLTSTKVAVERGKSTRPLQSFLVEVWDEVAKHYRNEYIYKNEIASRLVFGRHSPRTAGLQIELPVGRSVVDVAVFNGTSTAYEIKTEYDSTRRLESQAKDYLKAFDKVLVVTDNQMVNDVISTVDSRVGVVVLSRTGSLQTIRVAQSNQDRLDPTTIFRCLRRNEYLNAIQRLTGSIPDLPNGLIASHCERLFSSLSSVQAHEVFVSALRSRTTDQASASFLSSLPPPLRALGFATPLSASQRSSLLDVLGSPCRLHLST